MIQSGDVDDCEELLYVIVLWEHFCAEFLQNLVNDMNDIAFGLAMLCNAQTELVAASMKDATAG